MRVPVVLALLLAGCLSSAPPDNPDEPAENDPSEDPRSIHANEPINLDELNTTELSAEYTGHGAGPWAFNTGCDPIWDPGGPELGGTCFHLITGTRVVKFAMADDVSPNVGTYVRTPTGAQGFFCDQGEFAVTEPGWIMFVMEDTGACALGPGAGVPTTGTISVTMFHP